MQTADGGPAIMLITDVISKGQINPIAPALLNIDGYNCTSNFDINTVDLVQSRQSLQVKEIENGRRNI